MHHPLVCQAIAIKRLSSFFISSRANNRNNVPSRSPSIILTFHLLIPRLHLSRNEEITSLLDNEKSNSSSSLYTNISVATIVANSRPKM